MPFDDVTNGNDVFSGVAALRNQLGADLVVLLSVFKEITMPVV